MHINTKISNSRWNLKHGCYNEIPSTKDHKYQSLHKSPIHHFPFQKSHIPWNLLFIPFPFSVFLLILSSTIS